MSDDRSGRSWLDRLGQAFSGEPQDVQELIELLRDACERNLFNAEVLAIIEGALQVGEMQVRDVMIPRSQMITIDASDSPDTFVHTVIESAHSRFPLLGASRDEVQGILLAKDLLPYFVGNENQLDRLEQHFDLYKRHYLDYVRLYEQQRRNQTSVSAPL